MYAVRSNQEWGAMGVVVGRYYVIKKHFMLELSICLRLFPMVEDVATRIMWGL